MLPALAIEGRSFTTIAIVAVEAAHGALEIVHAKILVPDPNPVTVVLGEVGLVIVPVPEMSVHKPVPTVAELALIIVFGDETQIV